jgi:lipid-binding SYLF domain-containing protein
MKPSKTTILLSLAIALALVPTGCTTSALEDLEPENTTRLNADATAALQQLYAINPAAKALGGKARAILIFPDVLKGGFMFAGEMGNGLLRQKGRTTGYYNITAASYGLQAGVQTFGYALFFMNDAALKYLSASGGWQIGAGPSVVVVDEGMAKTLTTTTLTQDVYAFVFGQSGLMAGMGLEGSKITQIHP